MLSLRHLGQACRHLRHRLGPLHPFEVEASLLDSCNLRCVYCRGPSIGRSPMSTAEWRGVIRRVAALGTVRLKFHGGEPTLRDDFRELCAASREAGMLTAAVTNGTVIARRPELLDHLDELVVSMDSPHEENNDRLRGAGSYQRAVKTLELARARPGLGVFLNMVLTRLNVDDLEDMLVFCERRGIGVNAQPVVFGRGFYQGQLMPDLALTATEIREVHRRLVAWKRQGRGLLFSLAAYQKALDWPDLDVLTTRSEGRSRCFAGTYYVRIEANGDVVPCCQNETDFRPGNIVRDGIDAALAQARNHQCGDCWLAYYAERMAVFGLRPAALWNAVRRV